MISEKITEKGLREPMNHKMSSMARKNPKIDGYAPQRAIFTPILPRNPENGALRPGFCDFYAHFSVFGPLRPLFCRGFAETNKTVHRTAHKLPIYAYPAMIASVTKKPGLVCALSGDLDVPRDCVARHDQ